jgi:uncharacterized protein
LSGHRLILSGEEVVISVVFENSRIVTLDILRGFAVLGILVMNIQSFALPSNIFVDPQVVGGNRVDNVISYLMGFIFFEGKMRGLFSVLFGASMMLFIQRALLAEQDPVKSQLRRLFWLGIFGLLHMFLIWNGDILFLYAVVGCAAIRVRDWPSKQLIKVAIALFALGIAFNASTRFENTTLEMAIYDGSASLEQKKIYAEHTKEIETYAAEEREIYAYSYPALVKYRLTEEWTLPAIYVIYTFLETMPLMMLGMALYQNGFLTGNWDKSRYRKIAWQFLGIGVILSGMLAGMLLAYDFRPSLTVTTHLVLNIIPQYLMTVGYAALFILWAKRSALTMAGAAMAAVGRMAFTNYIMTSIVMTFIFNGYGLAYWGKYSQAQLWLFVIGAWLAMLLWSKPWLNRYKYGPLEWLWRSLAKGQMQATRR